MDKIIMYCDGACKGNGTTQNAVGGWGVYLVYKDNTKRLYGGSPSTTNNIMELTACIEGLKALKRKDIPIILYTDSNYVVKGMTEWIEGWKAKGWTRGKNKPLLNVELWKTLDALCQTYQVQFVWVKGHADNLGNLEADRLANLGAQQYL